MVVAVPAERSFALFDLRPHPRTRQLRQYFRFIKATTRPGGDDIPYAAGRSRCSRSVSVVYSVRYTPRSCSAGTSLSTRSSIESVRW